MVQRLAGVAVIVAVAIARAGGAAAAGDSRLVDAARAGDVEAVRNLLAKRADVNGAARDGTTALHWAIERGDGRMADALLAAGANPNAANAYRATPLLLACRHGRGATVEQLLKAGADPRAATSTGQTLAMTCARTGDVVGLRALLDAGIDVNAKERLYGQTALMWAAAQRHTAAVQFLLGRGADIRARSAEGPPNGPGQPRQESGPTGGLTPLLFAVRSGDVPTIQVLLDAGADVHDTAADGTTALVLATLNAHYDAAALLLDRGADPNRPDRRGSALHVLAWVRRQAQGVGNGQANFAPRVSRSRLDSLGLAEKLIARGIDIDRRLALTDLPPSPALAFLPRTPADLSISVRAVSLNGATPLWLAAQHADVEFLRFLVSKGADPSIRSVTNVTPLMVAAGAGFVQGESGGTDEEAFEATKFLLDLGADVNAVADYGNAVADLRFSGQTALHGAALRGAFSVIELLVERKARLDAETVEGWTPFNIAEGVKIGCCLKTQPAAAELLRRLMTERGIAVVGRRDPNSIERVGTGG